MNEHEQLLRRLDELGDTAVANAVERPFDPHRGRRHPRRHRRRWLAATAVVAVAVAGSALWAQSVDDGDQVHTVATAPDPDDFPRLLPESWIADPGGTIVTRDPGEPTPQFDVIASHLLTRDGAAAASAQVIDYPVSGFGPDVGNAATPDTIDGRDALWFSGISGTGLVIALEPGRSLAVDSSSASSEELTAVALAYDRDRLTFDIDEMPHGWSTAPDPAHLVDLYDGRPPQTWASARHDDDSGDPIFLAATYVPDPSAILEQIAGLTGHRSKDVEVHGKPGITILGVGPQPGAAMLVWAHDEGTVAAVSAPGTDPDDLLTLAESVREVDEETWKSFTQPPRRPGGVVDGFELANRDEDVVDSGEAFGHRWMVTTGVASRHGGSGTFLYLLDPEGNQHGSGWGGSGGPSIGGGGVIGRFRYHVATVPREVSDAAIVLHGQRREVVQVDTGGDTLTIFTIVESRSTPAIEPGDLYVTGTLSDGTTYRNPPDLSG